MVTIKRFGSAKGRKHTQPGNGDITFAPPPKEGLQRMMSNPTRLYPAGIPLNCDNCGIAFRKPDAWAKRTEHHFCGRGCASDFRRIRINIACVVCGRMMHVIPSDALTRNTCKRECKSLNYIKRERPNTFQKREKRASNINICCDDCGSKDQLRYVHSTSATLCLSCFGKHNSPHALAARKEKHGY